MDAKVRDVMTMAEAARSLGLAASTVRGMVRDGRIKTVPTAGGSKLVPVSEVERYRRDHLQGKPGRPRAATS